MFRPPINGDGVFADTSLCPKCAQCVPKCVGSVGFDVFVESGISNLLVFNAICDSTPPPGTIPKHLLNQRFREGQQISREICAQVVPKVCPRFPSPASRNRRVWANWQPIFELSRQGLRNEFSRTLGASRCSLSRTAPECQGRQRQAPPQSTGSDS